MAMRSDGRGRPRLEQSRRPGKTAREEILDAAAELFTDLGVGYYQARTDTDRKIRNHIRQIQALGFEVTITKAA